jgi:hypothetical protein
VIKFVNRSQRQRLQLSLMLSPISRDLPAERIETRSLPALTHVLPPTSASRLCPSMSLASPRLRSLAASLAALPSMSLIPFVPLYLACSRALDRYLTALPAMSLAPVAPFPHSRRVLCRSVTNGNTGPNSDAITNFI